jgi:hypothetical protein
MELLDTCRNDPCVGYILYGWIVLDVDVGRCVRHRKYKFMYIKGEFIRNFNGPCLLQGNPIRPIVVMVRYPSIPMDGFSFMEIDNLLVST